MKRRCFSTIRTGCVSQKIHPQFFSDFIAPVCKRIRPDEPTECIASVRIPSYEMQEDMVQQLHSIQQLIDIHEIENYVAQLIWMQNDDVLSQLLIAIQKYNLSMQQVQDIIDLV